MSPEHRVHHTYWTPMCRRNQDFAGKATVQPHVHSIEASAPESAAPQSTVHTVPENTQAAGAVLYVLKLNVHVQPCLKSQSMLTYSVHDADFDSCCRHSWECRRWSQCKSLCCGSGYTHATRKGLSSSCIVSPCTSRAPRLHLST